MIRYRSWTDAAAELDQSGQNYAIATVIATAGSTPRASGSKMVISIDHTYDSIGGGQLEFLVVNRAREMLQAGLNCQEIKQFPLAVEARQCCGGAVTVMLECFAVSRIPLAVFGAGHVARALVPILQQLPFSITWVDSRPEFFEEFSDSSSNSGLTLDKTSGSALNFRVADAPEEVIDQLPDGAYVLVLTHDHAQDYSIIEAALERGSFDFVGLIGSENKARRFRARLKSEGIDSQQIDAMHCPVGIAEVKGKLPMEVAVSIAGQLVASYGPDGTDKRSEALNWKEMKNLMAGRPRLSYEKKADEPDNQPRRI